MQLIQKIHYQEPAEQMLLQENKWIGHQNWISSSSRELNGVSHHQSLRIELNIVARFQLYYCALRTLSSFLVAPMSDKSCHKS